MFIQVTLKSDNSKRLINSEIINYILPLDEGGCYISCFHRTDKITDEYRLRVIEDYETIRDTVIKN